ncbi:ferredoxin--NADP reductase [Pseudoxanthomonas sp. GM95]|uniref:ferredoxin--NADP reductase n=1 Tax=Pseudoxanthomonas sp. GM95 TaxID=1881043 RepID=UPI000B88C418|nr:ferredoxin--NADP reductase [Pseudoxanthomonas sp. GM95]
MIAPTVGHYVFQRNDGQPLAFIAGQFLQIHFDYADGTATRRSYSIANVQAVDAPAETTVEIAVSYVPGGAATALFEALDMGDTVQASGPFGRFTLQPSDANARYVLVATGTGVTPYRAMLPALAALIDTRAVEVVLLQGARTLGDLLYHDEFRAFADAHPGFRYLPCLSRGLPDDAHPDLRHGYVQQALPEIAPDPAREIAYLCGNPDMVDATFEALKNAGLGPAQIRREKYISSR